MNLGAQRTGMHSFDWAGRAVWTPASKLTFRVTATSGSQRHSPAPR